MISNKRFIFSGIIIVLMKTTTLILLIPLLVCVGFIPVIGIFIVIGIILWMAYKEVGNTEESRKIINMEKPTEIDEIFEDVLEKGR